MTTNLPNAPVRSAPAYDAPGPRASWKQVPRDLAYLLPGFPIALAAFVLVVVGVSLGFGLALLTVGVPILVATLAAARGFAALERARVRACEQRPLAPTYYRTVTGSFLQRTIGMVRDPQYWRDALHAVVALPVNVFTWGITIAWVSAGFGGTFRVLYAWALPEYPENVELLDLAGIHSDVLDTLLYTVVGVLFLISMPPVLRWAASLDASLARGLLANPVVAENAALRARAEQLRASRAAAAEAEATTLRRVERDIHDGPQQRLVRLTMDLEAAQRGWPTTPRPSARSSRRHSARPRRRSPSCGHCPVASPRPSSPTADWRPPSRLRPRVARCRSHWRWRWAAPRVLRHQWRTRPTSSSPRR